MARLTKADRRKAALKGWRKRTRTAPKRRNASKASTSTASRTRTATSTKATTAGNKTSTSTGGASTSGGNVSITVKHNPAWEATWHGHTASFPTARAAQNWKSALQRAWREDPDLAERAAYAGKDYRKVIKQGMKRNPPKGFIPCRAVKITRNRGGGVEVRIKRR